MNPSFNDIMRDYIDSSESIDRVFYIQKGNNFDIWFTTSDPDKEARESIYDIEYQILNSGLFDSIDFHLITIEDDDDYLLIPSNAIEIEKNGKQDQAPSCSDWKFTNSRCTLIS